MRLVISPPNNIKIGFNPRICKRCDRGSFGFSGKNSVSIHASVKDATFTLNSRRAYPKVSIHASVKDATYYIDTFFDMDEFQSTHL